MLPLNCVKSSPFWNKFWQAGLRGASTIGALRGQSRAHFLCSSVSSAPDGCLHFHTQRHPPTHPTLNLAPETSHNTGFFDNFDNCTFSHLVFLHLYFAHLADGYLHIFTASNPPIQKLPSTNWIFRGFHQHNAEEAFRGLELRGVTFRSGKHLVFSSLFGGDKYLVQSNIC